MVEENAKGVEQLSSAVLKDFSRARQKTAVVVSYTTIEAPERHSPDWDDIFHEHFSGTERNRFGLGVARAADSRWAEPARHTKMAVLEMMSR